VKQLGKFGANKRIVAVTDNGAEYIGEITTDQPRMESVCWGTSPVENEHVFDSLLAAATWHNGPHSAEPPLVESPIVLPDILECAIFGRQQ
jgi:hypothetical protein